MSALRALPRRVAHGVLWLALAAVVAGWVVFLRPEVLGGSTTFVVVHGDSMRPRYTTGDLVVLRRDSAYHVHEVVAYRVPRGQLGAGAIIIHRIVGGDATAGFVVKGDNNPAPDPWHPRASDIVGAEEWHVPSLGTVLARLRTPAVMAALAAGIAAAVVVSWQPRRQRHDAASRC